MNIALILAGGRGSRMGGELPKQFIEVDGVPIIIRTAEKFQQHREIDRICLVCLAEHCETLREMTAAYGLTKVCAVLPGGASRQESSFLGVEALHRQYGPEALVLIHDAARPNVTAEIISENIRAASNIGACNTVIPSQDTILISRDGRSVSAYTDRREMYLVQTPQTFRLGIIYEAHLSGRQEDGITDDCSLVLRAGGQVGLVSGSKENGKITTPEDLRWLSRGEPAGE